MKNIVNKKREREHNLINILVNASLLIVTNHHSNSKAGPYGQRKRERKYFRCGLSRRDQ